MEVVIYMENTNKEISQLAWVSYDPYLDYKEFPVILRLLYTFILKYVFFV